MSDAIHLKNDHQIEIILPDALHARAGSFQLTAKKDPDIPITIVGMEAVPKKTDAYVLTTQVPLSAHETYRLVRIDTGAQWTLIPSLFAVFFTVLMTAALIQNFVFTRYLGLCVFFGVSRKKETAIGMGVTFTIVGVLSGLMAWIIDRCVLAPLSLEFLQIVIFIGIVAFLVQMTDTILRKIQRTLHKKFGIYVLLITTNCIILAVPLLNALNKTGFWESLAMALGSGLGFALALFLMSCAREKTDLAPVPLIFRGLPIAFILAGLFALAFLGFSGLKI